MPRTKVEKFKDDTALAAVEERATSIAAKLNHTESALMLGGINAVNHVAHSLSVKAIRAIEVFGEAEAYKQFGFDNLAEFLDNSPHSPMTKNQYYDRRNVLLREGDAAFEALNEIGIPVSKRKLLTQGSIEIIGDEIIIGDHRARLDDRNRITEIIRTFADKNAEQQRTIKRGESDNLKLKKKLDDVKDSAPAINEQYLDLKLRALGSIGEFAHACSRLPDTEAFKVRDETMNMMSLAWANLRRSLRYDETLPAELVNNPLHDVFTDDEIAELGDAM